MFTGKNNKGEIVRKCTISITDEQAAFLKERCISKTELLKKLIIIRMQEPGLGDLK